MRARPLIGLAAFLGLVGFAWVGLYVLSGWVGFAVAVVCLLVIATLPVGAR